MFNMFINDLDDGTTCNPSQSVDDTNLGGVADTPEGCATIQRDLNRPEKRTDRNVMQFNKGKCKVLHLGRKKPMHQCRPGGQTAGKQLGRKGPGCLGGHRVEYESAMCPCYKEG